jgi:hypothetical protein
MKQYCYFMVEGWSNPLGYILKSKVEEIAWTEKWKVLEERIVLSCGASAEERSSFMAETLQKEHDRGRVPDLRKLSNELYAVCHTEGKVILKMSRSAAGLFGIRTFGVFLIAFAETNEGRKFWIAERSKNKMTHRVAAYAQTSCRSTASLERQRKKRQSLLNFAGRKLSLAAP